MRQIKTSKLYEFKQLICQGLEYFKYCTVQHVIALQYIMSYCMLVDHSDE
jgi:hypothetical protein